MCEAGLVVRKQVIVNDRTRSPIRYGYRVLEYGRPYVYGLDPKPDTYYNLGTNGLRWKPEILDVLRDYLK